VDDQQRRRGGGVVEEPAGVGAVEVVGDGGEGAADDRQRVGAAGPAVEGDAQAQGEEAAEGEVHLERVVDAVLAVQRVLRDAAEQVRVDDGAVAEQFQVVVGEVGGAVGVAAQHEVGAALILGEGERTAGAQDHVVAAAADVADGAREEPDGNGGQLGQVVEGPDDGVGAVVVDQGHRGAGHGRHGAGDGGEVERRVVEGDGADDVDLVVVGAGDVVGAVHLGGVGRAGGEVQVAGGEDAGAGGARGQGGAAVDRDGAGDVAGAAETWGGGAGDGDRARTARQRAGDQQGAGVDVD